MLRTPFAFAAAVIALAGYAPSAGGQEFHTQVECSLRILQRDPKGSGGKGTVRALAGPKAVTLPGRPCSFLTGGAITGERVGCEVNLVATPLGEGKIRVTTDQVVTTEVDGQRAHSGRTSRTGIVTAGKREKFSVCRLAD